MKSKHPFDLTGHVALVTGGNSGVGLGMAEGLARAGADVCIWGRNPKKNEDAVKRLTAHGGRVASFEVDISDEEAVVAGFARILGEFGRLDSCLANAALANSMTNPAYLDSTLEQWRSLMRVDLDGAYLTTREAARIMVRQGDGGSIVLTSSIAALFGSPREQAYAAAKAGLLALARSLAVEFGRHRIRANAVLPGWTRSPVFDAWLENPAVEEKVMARIPLRRWGTPEDWAGVAVYLAGDASSFHTGDCLRIDGGYGVF
ncbi:SDR family oxidoreductase [Yinghuangia sp. ASG 101]|uniref:SDR family NAD(P)-dependent oxidoreductase n=1 Tax=Yinghuangia sp. ASG 101 TaxID=2896848 RepID=UPI001E574B84|nr:SDR family oxidoreductase [Yinghuangia sp. ASG 101]UGQ11184.1 SDR family oxidoreductase [Yinghuangia sp. ASG 101]